MHSNGFDWRIRERQADRAFWICMICLALCVGVAMGIGR